MNDQNSNRFELDARNVSHVLGAAFIGALSIYASNTEFFNAILKQYMSGKTFIVVSMVLAYLLKKFLTDYSQK